MKRNSTELKVKYHGNKDKPVRKKNPNTADISKQGYRDDSPYNTLPYIDIHTPSGSIDMSGTGIPLWANGRILPPYSGLHQFDTTQVREIPLAQKGINYRTGESFDSPSLTQLTPSQEIAYQKYKTSLGEYGNDEDYDLRGYWKNEAIKGLSKSGIEGQHFTDKYKIVKDPFTSEYPVLSNESQYASEFDRRGQGYWVTTDEVPLDSRTINFGNEDDKIWQFRTWKKGGSSGWLNKYQDGGMKMPPIYRGGDQDWYDPVADIIYLSNARGDESLGHELYHKQQRDEGRLRVAEEDLYGEARRKPSMLEDQAFVDYPYYNRRAVDQDILTNDFLYNNPSFNLVSPEAVYKYGIDPGMYNTPWTAEGEAMASESPEGRAWLESQGIGPKDYKKKGGVSSTKAKEILRDGSVHGHPLTDKQKRYFGWIAGGKKAYGGPHELPAHLPEAYKKGGWLKKYQSNINTGQTNQINRAFFQNAVAQQNILPKQFNIIAPSESTDTPYARSKVNLARQADALKAEKNHRVMFEPQGVIYETPQDINPNDMWIAGASGYTGNDPRVMNQLINQNKATQAIGAGATTLAPVANIAGGLLEAAPIAALPHLTAGNALNALMVKHGVQNIPQWWNTVSQATDRKGYVDAAKSTLSQLVNFSPAAKFPTGVMSLLDEEKAAEVAAPVLKEMYRDTKGTQAVVKEAVKHKGSDLSSENEKEIGGTNKAKINWLDKYQGTKGKSQTGSKSTVIPSGQLYSAATAARFPEIAAQMQANQQRAFLDEEGKPLKFIPDPRFLGTDPNQSIIQSRKETGVLDNLETVGNALLHPATFALSAAGYLGDIAKNAVGLPADVNADLAYRMRQYENTPAGSVPGAIDIGWQILNPATWFGNPVTQVKDYMYGPNKGKASAFQPLIQGAVAGSISKGKTPVNQLLRKKGGKSPNNWLEKYK